MPANAFEPPKEVKIKLPQLSLRDLFWLVLVCGLGIALAISCLRSNREAAKWREAAEYWQAIAVDRLEFLAKEGYEQGFDPTCGEYFYRPKSIDDPILDALAKYGLRIDAFSPVDNLRILDSAGSELPAKSSSP